MNIQHISSILNSSLDNVPSLKIEHFSVDSRDFNLNNKSLFFALKYTRNGHDFIPLAYQKGVRFFVVSQKVSPLKDAFYIRVNDTLEALQKLAIYHRKSFPIDSIGITGTNGKTILKEWLWQSLQSDFNIVRSPKSYNSQIGVALSLLNIQKHHDLGIFEAGISQVEEMQNLADMIQPSIGVFTHMGIAHRTSFEDKKTHILEKLKLFKSCKTIVYNANDLNFTGLIQQKFKDKKLLSFGYSSLNDICIKNIETKLNKANVSICFKNSDYLLSLNFSNKAYIENAVCLFAVLSLYLPDVESIIKRIKKLTSVEMRLQIVEGFNNFTLINDTYNSDLQSIEIALDFLEQQTEENKVLVFSDLEQIEKNEAHLYKKLKQLFSKINLKQIIAIGPKSALYLSDIKTPIFHYNSTKKFIKDLPNFDFKNSAILLKGARKYAFENILAQLENKVHDTVLEINLTALRNNYNVHKSLLKKETKIMGMVKAFSYGSGGKEVAEALQQQKVDYLGVAYADEGVSLRKEGIYTPIMVMNPEVNSYKNIIKYFLEPEIYSFRQFENFLNTLPQQSITTPYPIHLKIDTGMHRLGFEISEIPKLINLLKKKKLEVKVMSIFSHLVASDSPEHKAFTLTQISLFETAYQQISQAINYAPIKHILNSSGIVNYTDFQFDMVRLGLGLYGYTSAIKIQENLQNVGVLKSKISQIKKLKKGESIGYGRAFFATKDSLTATIPIGYADGINRLLSNQKGWVNIHGKKAFIVGNVCMDMLMVDVTEIACNEGDEVILMGKSPNINDIAKLTNTINYEVLTSISPRVKRIFYEE